MNLRWHDYEYFPYERELAIREARTLLNGAADSLTASELKLDSPAEMGAARRLTYFAALEQEQMSFETDQRRLETSAGGGRRQATRYSVHGLHEYKGKFNPQVCRALMNIFDIREGGLVLDPFCGSGTSLVEATHLGIRSLGTDLNPLAVFLANAKLQAIRTPEKRLRSSFQALEATWSSSGSSMDGALDARTSYLSKWFEPEHLEEIERAKRAILTLPKESRPFFLSIASNLLRDYSLQDPSDLRIRRRSTADPPVPFRTAFFAGATAQIAKVAAAQDVVGVDLPLASAILADNRELKPALASDLADGALTSPPYATALPYIDTQRLSIIWLGLAEPKRILHLEANLTGSREMDTVTRRMLPRLMAENHNQLPGDQLSFCLALAQNLTERDGFRRQAVPHLLYRYFVNMRDTFAALRKVLRAGAPFGLIVGHNHTVLGGTRFDINTPVHLSELAGSVGWVVEELVPLQTYRRYGLHAGNAVGAESLILLRN